MKVLNTKDAYCKYMKNTATHSISQKIFKLDNDTLYTQTQNGDKSFKALMVLRSPIPFILMNLHHLQGHMGTIKLYNLIKREFYWKGMHKYIDKFIQDCNICKQHNLQKESYSYIHMTPGKKDLLNP